MSHLGWLWSYAGKKRDAYALGLIIAAFSSAMIIINPLLSQRLIDDVIIPGNTGPLPRLLITMLGVQLIRLSLRYTMIILMELNSTHTMTQARWDMYQMVQSQDYRFRSRFPTGNLMTSMTMDLDRLRHTAAWVTYQRVDAVVIFTSALSFLMFVNWRLALCLAAVTPFILYLSRRFTKRICPRFLLLRRKLTALSTAVSENIDGNRVVRAFAREEYEKDHFEKFNADFRDSGYENALISAKYQPLLEPPKPGPDHHYPGGGRPLSDTKSHDRGPVPGLLLPYLGLRRSPAYAGYAPGGFAALQRRRRDDPGGDRGTVGHWG
jgi:ATP-binding cassette subfamily B protein